MQINTNRNKNFKVLLLSAFASNTYFYEKNVFLNKHVLRDACLLLVSSSAAVISFPLELDQRWLKW